MNMNMPTPVATATLASACVLITQLMVLSQNNAVLAHSGAHGDSAAGYGFFNARCSDGTLAGAVNEAHARTLSAFGIACTLSLIVAVCFVGRPYSWVPHAVSGGFLTLQTILTLAVSASGYEKGFGGYVSLVLVLAEAGLCWAAWRGLSKGEGVKANMIVCFVSCMWVVQVLVVALPNEFLDGSPSYGVYNGDCVSIYNAVGSSVLPHLAVAGVTTALSLAAHTYTSWALAFSTPTPHPFLLTFLLYLLSIILLLTLQPRVPGTASLGACVFIMITNAVVHAVVCFLVHRGIGIRGLYALLA